MLALPYAHGLTRYYAGYVLVACQFYSCSVDTVGGISAQNESSSSSIVSGQGLGYWVALSWFDGWLSAGYALGETPIGFFTAPIIYIEWSTPDEGYRFINVSPVTFGSWHSFSVRESTEGLPIQYYGKIVIDGVEQNYKPRIPPRLGQAIAELEAFPDSQPYANGHWLNLQFFMGSVSPNYGNGFWQSWGGGLCSVTCTTYGVVSDCPYVAVPVSSTEFNAGLIGCGGGGTPVKYS